MAVAVSAGTIVPALGDLKEHLNITSATHDVELQHMLDAAVQVVEGYVGRLNERSVTETHRNGSGGGPLVLRESPVVSVLSVASADGTTYAAADYDLDGPAGMLHVAGGYGRWPRGVTVTYLAGRSELPAAIRLAVLIVAGRLWETQRGNAPSALPVSDDGFTADPGGLPLLPPRARELLRPYLLVA